VVSTSSYTYTYSVTDVRKVMSQLHAEFRMAAQSTGLRTAADVDEVMADITRFAEEDYLERVQLRLVNSSGKNVKVATTKFRTMRVGGRRTAPAT